MVSQPTLMCVSKYIYSEASMEEYNIPFQKYFGNCALNNVGELMIFHPEKRRFLQMRPLPNDVIKRVFYCTKDYILYSTPDLYCSWLEDGKIVFTLLLEKDVISVAVGEGSQPTLIIKTNDGKLKRTILKQEPPQWELIKYDMPEILDMVVTTMGSVEFIMVLKRNHEATIYLCDQCNDLKTIESFNEVKAVARFRGNFYILQNSGALYEWGHKGMVLKRNRLLTKIKYETVLLSEHDSNLSNENNAYCYFTLEEYIKELKNKQHCYLEIL